MPMDWGLERTGPWLGHIDMVGLLTIVSPKPGPCPENGSSDAFVKQTIPS